MRMCAIATLAMLCLCRPAAAQDRLEPEPGVLADYEHHLEYHKNIRNLLFADRFRVIARVVCMPSFHPEWAASVFENEGDDVLEVATVEGGTIWTDEPEQLRVIRRTVPLTEATATTLGEVWTAMIRRTIVPDDSHTRGMADGVAFHFSCWHPLVGPISGQIGNPFEGSVTYEFAEIGVSMWRLAEVPDADRENLEIEVRARALELIDRLRSLDEPSGGGRSRHR